MSSSNHKHTNKCLVLIINTKKSSSHHKHTNTAIEIENKIKPSKKICVYSFTNICRN